MTTYWPPKVNTQLVWYASLYSQADPTAFKSNPTLAAGDFTLSTDGGTVGNFGTLPTVTPASSMQVKFTASTAEMNGARAHAMAQDAAGAEWISRDWDVATVARQHDDLLFPATSGRSVVVDASGLVDALVVKLGPTGSGTGQTARDIGTSVLLSAGTGTGQLDFTAGVVKSNLAQILGTAITETAGQIAAAFKKFFDIAGPTSTMNTITAVTTTVALTTNNDKTGYALSSAGVQAILDFATSSMIAVGSWGKMMVDKLIGVSGQVAAQSEVTGIQNNTRTVLVVPDVIERPDSGTDTYLFHLYLYDDVGNMEAPDSAPTLALANSAGTDRSSRLGSATGTLVAAGHYKWAYTNTSTDTLEQILSEFTVVEGGATRVFGRQSLLVDTSAVDFTASDRTNLTTALGVLQHGTYGNSALQTIIAALNNLSQANIRTALGMGSPNLDTQLDALPTNSELAVALATADAAVLAAIAALFTTAMAESYAAEGAVKTPAQAFYEIRALLSEFSVSGTTMTTRRKDGATTAGTYTLDSATSPTSITRAS